MNLNLIVFGLVVFMAEAAHTANDHFYCYQWTEEDIAAMGPVRTVATEREYCENNLRYVFTQGNNSDYPKCGTCWCCQHIVQYNFYCYQWTEEDIAAMGPVRTVATEREYCENNLRYVFTQGNNSDYPKCGTCWCCQPIVQYNFTKGNNEYYPNCGKCWCCQPKVKTSKM